MNHISFAKINKNNYIIAFFVIVAITFGIYSNSLNNEFIDYWDDHIYVTGNELVKSLSFNNIKLIFSTIFWTDYYPVSLLTYAIDYHFWELNPLGYHITNVFIHSINAFFIFLIIITLIKSTIAAYITAIIFIIHPVNVETVVWISERKNLLSFLFMLIAFYLYIRSHKEKQRFFYIASIIAYIFALLSKSMVLMFPLILLLYDFCFTRKNLKLKIIDKIPFFVLSIVFSAITIIAFKGSAAFISYNEDLYYRILGMLRIFATYIGKVFIPLNLNNFYVNYISLSVFDFKVLISIFVLLLIAYFSYKCYKKDKIIFFCVLWFFLNLIPVSNIIPISHWMADRYLYYPSLGFSFFIAVVYLKICQINLLKTKYKLTSLKIPVLVLLSILIIIFSCLTLQRIKVWENSTTLWQDCVEKDSRNSLAHAYLGAVYMKDGFNNKAAEEFIKALKINPKRANALANFACLEMKKGLLDNAYEKINLALSYDDKDYEVHKALGIYYMLKGRQNDAILEFKRALTLMPESLKDFLFLYNNLGIALFNEGKIPESIESLNKALIFCPENKEVKLNLQKIKLSLPK